jgi:hypothetical protein
MVRFITKLNLALLLEHPIFTTEVLTSMFHVHIDIFKTFVYLDILQKPFIVISARKTHYTTPVRTIKHTTPHLYVQ